MDSFKHKFRLSDFLSKGIETRSFLFKEYNFPQDIKAFSILNYDRIRRSKAVAESHIEL